MIAYLGLGSNMGDRSSMFVQAVEMLDGVTEVSVLAVSPVYETDPVGGPPQEAYLNAAVSVETTLDSNELLDCCHRIEKQLGRVRRKKWGPRTIDIDLLLFGNMVIQSERLTVPHPRMHERAFVLRPLLDIAPDMVHPLLGETIRSLFTGINSTGERRYNDPIPGWPV